MEDTMDLNVPSIVEGLAGHMLAVADDPTPKRAAALLAVMQEGPVRRYCADAARIADLPTLGVLFDTATYARQALSKVEQSTVRDFLAERCEQITAVVGHVVTRPQVWDDLAQWWGLVDATADLAEGLPVRQGYAQALRDWVASASALRKLEGVR